MVVMPLKALMAARNANPLLSRTSVFWSWGETYSENREKGRTPV